MIEAGTAFSARRVHLADVAKAGETATRTTIYSTASTSGVVWVLKPGQEIKTHGHARAYFIPRRGRKNRSRRATLSSRRKAHATECAIQERRTSFSSVSLRPCRWITIPSRDEGRDAFV